VKELDSYASSYKEAFKFHDENLMLLEWYSRRILQTIRAREPASVLSLGIGHKVVAGSLLRAAGYMKSYTIVEGSDEMIRAFTDRETLPENASIVHSFFETYNADQKFGIIEAGFILEHVDDPLLILRKFAGFLEPDGCMFIAVPNALSLHRRIGHEAGMLDDLYQLSPHDIALGHKRYFEPETLLRLISDAGLRPVVTEGIYLKPFSLTQMNSLGLSSSVIQALLQIGVRYPELSNAIYVETAF
jgi:2-polyprenyl-3-methyl-5-hydroxy-6-metoxy-1,4-benzoquinol methylase